MDSICAGVARNSTAMVGIATLTMKASTPNMNCAATTMASTHQRRDDSTGVKTIWCMDRCLVRRNCASVISEFGYPRDYLGGKDLFIFEEAADRAGASEASFRDGPKDQTSDAQLRIGESRDSTMCYCTS